MKQNRMGASITKTMGLFLVVVLLGTNTGRADWFSDQATAAQKTAKKASAAAKQAGAAVKKTADQAGAAAKQTGATVKETAEQAGTAAITTATQKATETKADFDALNYFDKVKEFIRSDSTKQAALMRQCKSLYPNNLGAKEALKILNKLELFLALEDQASSDRMLKIAQRLGNGEAAIDTRIVICTRNAAHVFDSDDAAESALIDAYDAIRNNNSTGATFLQDPSNSSYGIYLNVAKDWVALSQSQRDNIAKAKRDAIYLNAYIARERAYITWNYGLTQAQRVAIIAAGKNTAYLDTSTQQQRNAILDWANLTPDQRNNITTAGKEDTYLDSTTTEERTAIVNQYGG